MENELVNIEFVDEKWSIEIWDVSLISFKKREIEVKKSWHLQN